MRRESRTLIEYVRGFSEPITKITLDLGFDDVPSVNCRVAIQKNSGLDYLSHHVLCYRGVSHLGKQRQEKLLQRFGHIGQQEKFLWNLMNIIRLA